MKQVLATSLCPVNFGLWGFFILMCSGDKTTPPSPTVPVTRPNGHTNSYADPPPPLRPPPRSVNIGLWGFFLFLSAGDKNTYIRHPQSVTAPKGQTDGQDNPPQSPCSRRQHGSRWKALPHQRHARISPPYTAI